MRGKHITIGITGSIAAYKIPFLIRKYKKAGAVVHIVATPKGLEFVSKLTLETLSENPVFIKESSHSPLLHIELAQKSDIFVVAPLSANTLSKIRLGLADNLLTSSLLASKKPVILCPAMNSDMWENPIIQDHVKSLTNIPHYHLLAPRNDVLACRNYGTGKMAALEEIFLHTEKYLSSQDFSGKKILVSTGPTREYLDQVRFLSNASSGIMGYNLALEAWKRGATVSVISGPTTIKYPSFIELKNIESTAEMHHMVKKEIPKYDIFISAAAVSDFTPQEKAPSKIQKSKKIKGIFLKENPDIVLLSQDWAKKCIRVGFALEEKNIISQARKKLIQKKLDLIIGNSLETVGKKQTTIAILDKKKTLFSSEKPILKRDAANLILNALLKIVPPRS